MGCACYDEGYDEGYDDGYNEGCVQGKMGGIEEMDADDIDEVSFNEAVGILTAIIKRFSRTPYGKMRLDTVLREYKLCSCGK